MFQWKEKVNDTVREALHAATQRSDPEPKKTVQAPPAAPTEDRPRTDRPSNAVLRGSKITGDIRISCDIDISGDVKGNITADMDAHVNLQGICVGTIKTGGDVVISGEIRDGDILSGGSVTISGAFHGGTIRANKGVHIDGEFSGRIESKEIHMGPNAQGKGEIVYQEHLSIDRGAKVEGTICCRPVEEVDRKSIHLLPRKVEQTLEKPSKPLIVSPKGADVIDMPEESVRPVMLAAESGHKAKGM